MIHIKLLTFKEQKDLNSFNSIVFRPDRLVKKYFYLLLQERIVFFWLPDVPIYQYFSRQVQKIAGKQSFGEGT